MGWKYLREWLVCGRGTNLDWMEERTICGLCWIPTAWYTYLTVYLIYLTMNILGHIFDLLDHLWMEERTTCGLRWIQTAWYTYSTIYLIYLFMYIVRTWPYIWFTWQTLDGGEDNLWSPMIPDRLIIVTSRSMWGRLQLIQLECALKKFRWFIK